MRFHAFERPGQHYVLGEAMPQHAAVGDSSSCGHDGHGAGFLSDGGEPPACSRRLSDDLIVLGCRPCRFPSLQVVQLGLSVTDGRLRLRPTHRKLGIWPWRLPLWARRRERSCVLASACPSA